MLVEYISVNYLNPQQSSRFVADTAKVSNGLAITLLTITVNNREISAGYSYQIDIICWKCP